MASALLKCKHTSTAVIARQRDTKSAKKPHFITVKLAQMTALFTFFLFMLLLAVANSISCKQGLELGAVQLARSGILHAKDWADQGLQDMKTLDEDSDRASSGYNEVALGDCLKLYEDSEPRLARIVSGSDYSLDDATAWLSAAMASHRSCLDGLEEKGMSFEFHEAPNLTFLLQDALASLRQQSNRRPMRKSKGLFSL